MLSSQSIQAVWFPISVDRVRASSIFEQVTGEEPSSVQSNKIPTPTNPFLGLASGRIGNIEVVVQVQPGRVDLFVNPIIDASNQEDLFQLLETGKALEFIARAIPKASDLQCVRAALVVNTIIPTETVEDARILIEELVGFKPPFADYSDFIFQINHRANFKDPDFAMNRNIRYNSLTIQAVAVDSNGVGTPFTIERFAAGVTIDLNSVVTGQVFKKHEVDAIFDQLAREAARIAASGALAAVEG